MDRRRLRLPFALVAAVVVAEIAVVLLRPRDGVIAPDPVRAESYFSAEQLDRARDFRRPQLALYGATLVLQGGLLVLLVRRPPRRVLDRLPRRPLLATAAGGAALALALDAVTLPVSAISRQRAIDVGLSTRSWPGWAQDVALSSAIGAALAGGGALLAVGVVRRLPRTWWLAASGGVVALGAGFVYATPVVLDPLFNRFEDLPPGRTRDDVLDLARRAGLEVDRVLVMDASKRTTAANAYVTGLGSTKRVVLYDTLVENFTRDEVRLVVAHEFAHVHHRDVPGGLLFLLLVAPAGMFAVSRMTARLSPGPVGRTSGPEILPALALSLAVVTTSVTWVSNQLSRRVEARADTYALRLTDAPEAFLSFKQRLAVRNISDPDPPRAVRFLLGTHPSVLERLGAGEAYRRARSVEDPPDPRTPGGS